MTTTANQRPISVCFSLFIFFSGYTFAQTKVEWIANPRHQWPQIALTNNVLYKNKDRYIHPSFKYAATGFLIVDKKETFAITAKHVLWIAKNKASKSVSVNRHLESWIMKPKGATKDSVIIDRLINEDTTEILEGFTSTIVERDVLVFSVKGFTPGIQPLKPRYSEVNPGERVFIIGHPYAKSLQTVIEGIVVAKLGMDILIQQFPNDDIGGLSGSPVVDQKGFLIGVFSSTTTHSGRTVSVAISTEYIKNVLEGTINLNLPKRDYGELIYQTVLKEGVGEAIQQYKVLISDPRNFYTYNLRSVNRNGLRETGERLMKEDRFKEAVEILEFNVKENNAYFHNYNVLARAWLLFGNQSKAIENYRISTIKLNRPEENEAFKELEKLEALMEKK